MACWFVFVTANYADRVKGSIHYSIHVKFKLVAQPISAADLFHYCVQWIQHEHLCRLRILEYLSDSCRAALGL